FFPLSFRIGLGSGDIRGDISVKASKMVHFPAIGANRGSFILYSLYFSCYNLNKRNFSPYFSSLFSGSDILVDLEIANQ
ncbi:hypothetical protein V6B33_16360, partial [Mangrovibacillus sp. Mu-81]|uniref:hypothetical protein n=1 Tax=Mangrovibacillus sp. Mu-81 TaxID=3121478 RepID=UPI002FE4832E